MRMAARGKERGRKCDFASLWWRATVFLTSNSAWSGSPTIVDNAILIVTKFSQR